MGLHDHSHLSNAPVPFPFKKWGTEEDVSLSLSPLTIRELGRFERWIRGVPIQLAREAIKDSELSEADKKLITAAAFEDAAHRTVTDENSISGYLQSAEGSFEFIRISMMRAMPEMTADLLAEWIGMDGDVITEMCQLIQKISGMDVPLPEGASGGGAGGGKDEPSTPSPT